MHVVVELAKDVRVPGVRVRREEPRVGRHPHPGQELVHRVRRLQEKRRFYGDLHRGCPDLGGRGGLDQNEGCIDFYCGRRRWCLNALNIC